MVNNNSLQQNNNLEKNIHSWILNKNNEFKLSVYGSVIRRFIKSIIQCNISAGINIEHIAIKSNRYNNFQFKIYLTFNDQNTNWYKTLIQLKEILYSKLNLTLNNQVKQIIFIIEKN